MSRIPRWCAALLLLPGVLSGAGRERSSLELANLTLGSAYSQWLVGPIAQLASEREIEDYLALRSDAAAEEFIRDFWHRRDPDASDEVNPLYGEFERRAAEADKRYSEAVYPGRRTDRGTIYILYGDPTEITYEELRDVSEPPVERWRYAKDHPPGLDGKRPARAYRFSKQGDLTLFFREERSSRRPVDSDFPRDDLPPFPP
jgi:GWxTD domain-containing protein